MLDDLDLDSKFLYIRQLKENRVRKFHNSKVTKFVNYHFTVFKRVKRKH